MAERAPVDLMERLCSQGVRLSGEPSTIGKGVGLRFWKVENGAVVLKVEVDLAPEAAPVGTKLWCVFENVGRTRTFRTVIRQVVLRPDGRLAAWHVDMPSELKSEDRRRAYRVPVIVGARFILELGDRQWPCTCRNMSVCGALLQLPEAVADALPDEARYTVVIDTFESTARPVGRIARRGKDGRVAVFFPKAVVMGEVKPPPDLAKVARELELRWLRKRSGKDAA